MKTADTNIIDNYFELLQNLSADNKLELISKLSNSLKSSRKTNGKSLKELFGSFKSRKSADKITSEVRKARTFNRKIESL